MRAGNQAAAFMACALFVACSGVHAGERAAANTKTHADAPAGGDQPAGAEGDADADNAQAPARFRRPDGSLDLDAVVQHFEDLYRSESSTSTAELTIVRPRRKRTLSMKIWTQGEDKALVVIQAPPREKGTATLKVDDNLWNYLPRIKRTIRIPPSMMLS